MMEGGREGARLLGKGMKGERWEELRGALSLLSLSELLIGMLPVQEVGKAGRLAGCGEDRLNCPVRPSTFVDFSAAAAAVVQSVSANERTDGVVVL